MSNLTNFIWNIAIFCTYASIGVLMLYACFRIIAYLITDIYARFCYSKEVKSITISFGDPSSENINKLTEKINLVKDSHKLSVKNIMNITTTPSDEGASCTVWYSVRKRKIRDKLYDSFKSYDSLKVLD